jgi:succinyl-diaminopimelate desuccinylase
MVTNSLFDRALEAAQMLIRVPSFNPPGHERGVAEVARDLLSRSGISSNLLLLDEDRASVVARVAGARSGGLVLCGHLDTVATDSAKWRTPPFTPILADGRLYGLGAADMKAGVGLILALAAELVERGVRPTTDLILVLTADEEEGYRGAAQVAESGEIADAQELLILEPTGCIVYGGQKGELWLEATFTGEEAHGSVPQTGRSAITPAIRFVQAVERAIAALPPVPDSGRTTLNVGQFTGGRQVNIVPDRAVVRMDIRVACEEHASSVLRTAGEVGRQFASETKTQLEMRTISYHPPITNPEGLDFARRMAEISGMRRGAERICPYSTDAVSIVPALKLPVAIYGPGHIEQAHRPNEYVLLSELQQASRELWAYVTRGQS